mgnify:CR=1 FL=1
MDKSYTSVGLFKPTYAELNRVRAEYEIELGKYVSFDECIKLLIKEKRERDAESKS